MHMAWILAATFVNTSTSSSSAQQIVCGRAVYAALSSLDSVRDGVSFRGAIMTGYTPVPSVLTWALLVLRSNSISTVVATFTSSKIDFIRYAASSGAIVSLSAWSRNVLNPVWSRKRKWWNESTKCWQFGRR
jgi:hypothetical protein